MHLSFTSLSAIKASRTVGPLSCCRFWSKHRRERRGFVTADRYSVQSIWLRHQCQLIGHLFTIARYEGFVESWISQCQSCHIIILPHMFPVLSDDVGSIAMYRGSTGSRLGRSMDSTSPRYDRGFLGTCDGSVKCVQILAPCSVTTQTSVFSRRRPCQFERWTRPSER